MSPKHKAIARHYRLTERKPENIGHFCDIWAILRSEYEHETQKYHHIVQRANNFDICRMAKVRRAVAWP